LPNQQAAKPAAKTKISIIANIVISFSVVEARSEDRKHPNEDAKRDRSAK
jgi:hypothetical protein